MHFDIHAMLSFFDLDEAGRTQNKKIKAFSECPPLRVDLAALFNEMLENCQMMGK